MSSQAESSTSESFTVSTPDGTVSPAEYSSAGQFKAAVYNAGGFGTWFDDIKLQVCWLLAHDKPIPPELTPVVPEKYLSNDE